MACAVAAGGVSLGDGGHGVGLELRHLELQSDGVEIDDGLEVADEQLSVPLAHVDVAHEDEPCAFLFGEVGVDDARSGLALQPCESLLALVAVEHVVVRGAGDGFHGEGAVGVEAVLADGVTELVELRLCHGARIVGQHAEVAKGDEGYF